MPDSFSVLWAFQMSWFSGVYAGYFIWWLQGVSLVAQLESACHAGDPGSNPGSGGFQKTILWKRDSLPIPVFLGFRGDSAGKESTCNELVLGSISGLGRSPGEGNSYPLQYSGLENSMDCISPWAAKSQTFTSILYFSYKRERIVWLEGQCFGIWNLRNYRHYPIQSLLIWKMSVLGLPRDICDFFNIIPPHSYWEGGRLKTTLEYLTWSSSFTVLLLNRPYITPFLSYLFFQRYISLCNILGRC